MTQDAGSSSKFIRRLRVLLITSIVLLSVGEIAIRTLGSTDEDGNFVLGGRRILPWCMPVQRTLAKADQLEEGSSFLLYDPDLGWAPVPAADSDDGMYAYDGAGARTASKSTALPERGSPESPLTVLIGDSFTHGDEVPFEDSFAGILSQQYGHRIVNLGVPGYAMDQAILRFEKHLDDLSPTTVVLGLQPENLQRNVNLVRSFLYWKTGLPFSKPRFLLTEDGLNLINQPALSPRDVAQLLPEFSTWAHSGHEDFYSPDPYEQPFWLRSRLAGVLATAIRSPQETGPASNQSALGLAILERLRSAASSAGCKLIIVHLPPHKHLDYGLADSEGRSPEQDFLDQVSARFDMLDLMPDLLEHASTEGPGNLFVGNGPGGHYTAVANGIVAAQLHEALR